MPILTAGVLSYFGYHIYHGEYGLYSRKDVEKHIVLLNSELEKYEGERVRLEKTVALLRDGTIERDMLDEWSRRSLNLSRPNELTIMTSTGDKSN